MAWGLGNIDWRIASTAAAAWVQAVGSVAAIVAAIWIERRAARRQRLEQEGKERLAERARAELGVAIWLQAAHIVGATESLIAALEHPATDRSRGMRRYDEWREDVTEQLDILRALLDRNSDPLVLLEAVNFMRGAKPRELQASANTHQMIWEAKARLAQMRAAEKHLQNKAAAMQRSAGLTGTEYLPASAKDNPAA